MIPFLVFAMNLPEQEHYTPEQLAAIEARWLELAEMELPIPGLRCMRCGGDVYLAACTAYGHRYCMNCAHLDCNCVPVLARGE